MAWAAFALYGCVVLLAAILQHCSLSRLRTHHHATWQQLGQPSFFWNNSIRNQMQWIGFSWTRRYRALGDPILNRMIVVQRILTVVVLLALLGFTVYIELGYRAVRRSVGAAPARVVSYDFPTSPLNWAVPCLVIAVLSNSALLLSCLRRRHPTTWERLGEPSLIGNNSLKNNVLVLWFVLTFQFRHLRDPLLNVLCAVQWIAIIMTLIMMFGAGLILRLLGS